MIDLKQYKTADLLPHGAPMVLVDEMIEWEQGRAATSVQISENSLFYTENGVPAHVGLEYMAQTCGTYSGLNFIVNNLPIRMGYLLGSRNYKSEVEYFKAGDKLIVSISEVLRQGPMGVFNCNISLQDKEVASAQLTVYQSDATASKL